jgi:hypothetical protein
MNFTSMSYMCFIVSHETCPMILIRERKMEIKMKNVGSWKGIEIWDGQMVLKREEFILKNKLNLNRKAPLDCPKLKKKVTDYEDRRMWIIILFFLIKSLFFFYEKNSGFVLKLLIC